MATLTSTKIKNTYDALLKSIDNDAIGTTAKQITDGLGNLTPLYISTTQIGIGVTPESGLNLHVFGDAKIGSNLTIIGNLVVEGNTTTVGTDTLTVKDPLIVLANNNTSTDAVDIGFYGKYTPSGTTLYSGLFREALTGKYRLFKDLQVEPTTTVNTSGTGYAQATLIAALEGNVTGNVTGGTISGTTGTFSGDVNVNSNLIVTTGTAISGSANGSNVIAKIDSSAGTDSGGLEIHTGDNNGDEPALLHTNYNGDEAFRITSLGHIISTGNGTFTGSLSASFFKGDVYANDGTSKILENGTDGTDATFTGDVTGNVTATSVLADGVTATTQSSGDNSTKVATTAYVDSLQISSTLSEILANGNTSGSYDIIMADDQKINFGDDSDLQIYHDGTDGYVQNGTGNLIIEQTTDDADIIFKNDNGSGDTVEYFRVDGSESRVVYGRSIQMADNVSVYFGNSVDDDGYIKWDSTADELFINGDTKFLEDATVVGSLYVGENIGGRAFSVKGTSTANLPFVSLVNTATSSHNGLLVTCDNTPVDYIADFRLGSTSKFRINANGNVTSTGSIQAVSLYGDLTSSSSSSGDYVRVYGGSGTGKWDIYGDGANLRISDNESAGILAVDTGATFGGNATFDGNVEINDTISSNFTTNYDTKLLVGGEIIARSLTANESMISIGGDSTSAFIKSGKQDGSQTARPFRIEVGTSEAMRIDSSGNATFTGNVGIGGAASSTHTLDLNSASNLALRFYDSTTFKAGMQAVDTGGQMISSSADGDFAIRSQSNMLFSTGGNTERMRIDSSGNVGIGIDPSYKLEIKSSGAGNYIQHFVSSDGASLGGFYENADTDALFFLKNASGAIKVEIDSDGDSYFNGGNVGIGTTPKAWATAGGTKALQISTRTALWEAYNGTYLSNNMYYDGGEKYIESDEAAQISLGGDGTIYFRNAVSGTADAALTWNERMRIDSNGNFGLNAQAENSAGTWRNFQFGSLSMFGRANNANPDGGIGTNFKFTTANAEQRISAHATSRIWFNDDVINFQNAGTGTANSAITWTQRMIIDSSGNVGIGTTNPSRNLTIGDGSGNSVLAIVAATNGLSQIGLGDSDDDNYGQIILRHSDGLLQIQNGGGGGISERGLNITSSENVGIGDTTPSYKLDVDGTIRATGDVIAYSDKRVKENIKTIDNSLEKVNQLRGVEFNKIGEDKKSIGVIAQEIENILPEVVREDDKGMKSVAYGNITGILIEAIKELKSEVEELKKQIK
jgi:hypothetical protein